MIWADILIYIAGILWGIELIPQIIKIYKSKNVESLSLPFFVICFFAYIIYGIGNAMLQNWVILISHIPSFIFLAITIGLIMKYRSKPLFIGKDVFKNGKCLVCGKKAKLAPGIGWFCTNKKCDN